MKKRRGETDRSTIVRIGPFYVQCAAHVLLGAPLAPFRWKPAEFLDALDVEGLARAGL